MVCVYCGGISVVDGVGRLRLPTEPELAQLAGHVGVQAMASALKVAGDIDQAVTIARRIVARQN